MTYTTELGIAAFLLFGVFAIVLCSGGSRRTNLDPQEAKRTRPKGIRQMSISSDMLKASNDWLCQHAEINNQFDLLKTSISSHEQFGGLYVGETLWKIYQPPEAHRLSLMAMLRKTTNGYAVVEMKHGAIGLMVKETD